MGQLPVFFTCQLLCVWDFPAIHLDFVLCESHVENAIYDLKILVYIYTYLSFHHNLWICFNTILSELVKKLGEKRNSVRQSVTGRIIIWAQNNLFPGSVCLNTNLNCLSINCCFIDLKSIWLSAGRLIAVTPYWKLFLCDYAITTLVPDVFHNKNYIIWYDLGPEI